MALEIKSDDSMLDATSLPDVVESVASLTACNIQHRSTSTSQITVGACCVVHCTDKPALPVAQSTHVWGHYRLMQIQGIFEVPAGNGSEWVVGLYPFEFQHSDNATLLDLSANSNIPPACTVWHLDKAALTYRPAADVVRPVQCVHLCTSTCKLPADHVSSVLCHSVESLAGPLVPVVRHFSDLAMLRFS